MSGDRHRGPTLLQRRQVVAVAIGTRPPSLSLGRCPPTSANTLHMHIRAEECYFVIEVESLPGSKAARRSFTRLDPKQLPSELVGVERPPKT